MRAGLSDERSGGPARATATSFCGWRPTESRAAAKSRSRDASVTATQWAAAVRKWQSFRGGSANGSNRLEGGVPSRSRYGRNAQIPDVPRRLGERAISTVPVCYPIRKECAHERSFRRTGRLRRGDLRLRPIRGAAPRKSQRFIIEDRLKQRDETRIMPALVGRERFRPASATLRRDR